MEYIFWKLVDGPAFGFSRTGGWLKGAFLHLKDHVVPHARNDYRPHLLADRALALFSLLLLSVKVFSFAVLAWGPAAPALSSAITQENIIALTNQSRQQFGLGPLSESVVLAQAAQAKAEDMLRQGYFAHNSPDGRTPWSFMAQVGYDYLMAGENLAVNFSEAESVEQAWMNSPGHKSNILNRHFSEIGIGVAVGQYQGNSAVFVVQMFGVPAAQKVALSEKPTELLRTEVPEPPLAAEPGMAVTEVQSQVRDGRLHVMTLISGQPVKVLLRLGERSALLQPAPGGWWAGEVSLNQLAISPESGSIVATDLAGRGTQLRLADFSGSLAGPYRVLGAAVDAKRVSWLGWEFQPQIWQQKFYLFFLAGLLASLIVAIAVKRHIQHLPLLANGALVGIFACLLYLAG